MRFIILSIGLLLAFAPLRAQRQLDLKECREMALEYSKQLAIAKSKKSKPCGPRKNTGRIICRNFSRPGFYLYHQKKQEYKLSGGYLPTYVPDADGKLQPNVVIGADGKPVMGTDGKPVFHEYAFLPDIPLTLSLRGVYMASVQLQQPLFMGGKIRAAHQAAKFGKSLPRKIFG
ncbi:MAG: hypothetical protein ACLU4J_02120 [Butyricimonas paravirosa]